MIGARTYFKQAEEVRTRLGDLAYEAAVKKDPELIKAVAEEISETLFSAQDALGQFLPAVGESYFGVGSAVSLRRLERFAHSFGGHRRWRPDMTETRIADMAAHELFCHLLVAQIGGLVLSFDELAATNTWLNSYFEHLSPGLEREAREFFVLESLYREHYDAAILMTDQDISQNDASGALDALLRKRGA